MEIIRTVRDMQRRANEERRAGRTIAIVPTMGFLHDGHVSLIRLARESSDVVVTTVFVNPAQFGPQEDFERYPRDLKRDETLAKQAGTGILFCPDVKEMYPGGFRTYVVTEEMASVLEGKFRPTHFRGVTTVVLKLFNIVKPHVAVFGQKDAQQAAILRTMIADLNLDIQMTVAPIVREPDGLAMSSRNVYLSSDERKRAAGLYRSLLRGQEVVQQGERNADSLRSRIQETLESARPDSVDYVAVVNPDTFQELERLEPPSALVALAVRFGRTRLIDNCLLNIPGGKAT